MPIRVHADVRRLDQDEFGEIAYEVMDHVFSVGRNFLCHPSANRSCAA